MNKRQRKKAIKNYIISINNKRKMINIMLGIYKLLDEYTSKMDFAQGGIIKRGVDAK